MIKNENNGIGNVFHVDVEFADGVKRTFAEAEPPYEKKKFSILPYIRKIEKAYDKKVKSYKVHQTIAYWYGFVMLTLMGEINGKGLLVFASSFLCNNKFVVLVDKATKEPKLLLDSIGHQMSLVFDIEK